MSEGFTVRGFLVAADNKTRRVRLRFSEADWVDFLDEQFPLGGEVYISAKNVASDLAAAEERGRREIADIVINAVLDIETTPRENWPSARDLLAKLTQDCGLQSDVFPLLNMCRAKEAGDDPR